MHNGNKYQSSKTINHKIKAKHTITFRKFYYRRSCINNEHHSHTDSQQKKKKKSEDRESLLRQLDCTWKQWISDRKCSPSSGDLKWKSRRMVSDSKTNNRIDINIHKKKKMKWWKYLWLFCRYQRRDQVLCSSSQSFFKKCKTMRQIEHKQKICEILGGNGGEFDYFCGGGKNVMLCALIEGCISFLLNWCFFNLLIPPGEAASYVGSLASLLNVCLSAGPCCFLFFLIYITTKWNN